MLQNAHLLAKIGADTAENERNFAENVPKIGKYTLRVAGRHDVQDPLSQAEFGAAAWPARRARPDAGAGRRDRPAKELHGCCKFC